jgi:hypothetical protein
MTEEIEKVLADIESFTTENLAHEELGTQSDFSLVEKYKQEIITLQAELLSAMKGLIGILPDLIILRTVTAVTNQLKQLRGYSKNIESIVKQGIHNPNFPTQRQNLINQTSDYRSTAIPQIFEMTQSVRLSRIEQVISKDESLKRVVEQSAKRLGELETTYNQSKALLGDISDLSFAKALKESAGTFDKLRENHARYERGWFSLFFTSMVAFAITVVFAVLTQYSQHSLDQTIVLVFKKLLVIALPIILGRISLAKYNLERNLRILYDHRSTVLEQYKSFEAAIGSDTPAKNSFRLEIAKFIFQDPITGYASDGGSSDISVNPVINLAEKIAAK